jgi:hypothetical protein
VLLQPIHDFLDCASRLTEAQCYRINGRLPRAQITQDSFFFVCKPLVHFVCLSIVPTVAPQSMQTSFPFRSSGVPYLQTGQSGRSAKLGGA